ncbi:hypothetical protein [Clostridium sardiniense]|uniref:hypothetical protein n=1 Tax=Clostridium sardiniense TaxID=29369 RepID=UPI003D33CF00
MKKKSFIFMMILIAILLIMEFIYKPYIYSRGMFDFFIAGSFPSLIMPVFLSAYMIFKDTSFCENKTDELILIAAPTLGLIVAEFISTIFPIGRFDIMDIVFNLLGGVLIYFVKKNLYDKWYNTIKLAHTI